MVWGFPSEAYPLQEHGRNAPVQPDGLPQTVADLCKSGQYGHQKHFLPDGSKEIRYGSTVRKPTDATLRLARGLLDGNTKPPETIERTRPTSFVEMGKASKLVGPDGKPLQPETTPERILKLQSRYGGIVARLGSWFLYAKNAPQITNIDQATPI